MRKIELLSPAGDMNKLKTAFYYGADAVYIGGKSMSLRALAGNFSDEELLEAVNYAHSINKKVYVTVNIFGRNEDIEQAEKYFKYLEKIGVDGAIVSDTGLIYLARTVAPNLSINLSTQANTLNYKTVEFWKEQGVKRVILARELSLNEIKGISDKVPNIEIETFIHGAMCISYSGRCLLSNFYTGRDANRGACAQPCRWNYKNSLPLAFSEEKRLEDPLNIEEYKEGSFVMSSKDMCMIEHISDLMESGIDSFKIEGRMKSAYYTAICANTYKMAINEYLKSPENYKYNPLWLRELESVSHREYATGFYYDNPMGNPQVVTQNGYLREKAYLCVATGDTEGEYTYFTQRNKIKEGDICEIITPGQVGKKFIATDLRLPNGDKIESAPHPSM